MADGTQVRLAEAMLRDVVAFGVFLVLLVIIEAEDPSKAIDTRPSKAVGYADALLKALGYRVGEPR